MEEPVFPPREDLMSAIDSYVQSRIRRDGKAIWSGCLEAVEWEIEQYALAAREVRPPDLQEHYADEAQSINVDNLTKALVRMGWATDTHEETAWSVGKYVNDLINSVLEWKVTKPAKSEQEVIAIWDECKGDPVAFYARVAKVG
jgi:hypothetical protein